MPKDPTQAPEFKRVLGNLLKAPPKPHSEMKLGKPTKRRSKSPKTKRAGGASAKPKTA